MASNRHQTAVVVMARPARAERRARHLPRDAEPMLAVKPLAGAFDVHVFADGRVTIPAGFVEHEQLGSTFAGRLDHALQTVRRLGYDRVIVVGTDVPELRSIDIERVVRRLDSKRLVIGPDARGGCWLIGLHTKDIGLLSGVVWQRDTDRRQLIERFGDESTSLLETKIDLDSSADLPMISRTALPRRARPLGLRLSGGVRHARLRRLLAQLAPPGRLAV